MHETLYSQCTPSVPPHTGSDAILVQLACCVAETDPRGLEIEHGRRHLTATNLLPLHHRLGPLDQNSATLNICLSSPTTSTSSRQQRLQRLHSTTAPCPPHYPAHSEPLGSRPASAPSPETHPPTPHLLPLPPLPARPPNPNPSFSLTTPSRGVSTLIPTPPHPHRPTGRNMSL